MVLPKSERIEVFCFRRVLDTARGACKRAARQATPSSAAHLDLAYRCGANCVAGIALAVLIALQEDVYSVQESSALDE